MPKQIDKTVDQTLTCLIGGLENPDYPVTVTWTDPWGDAVSSSDSTNYEIFQGTVDETGTQEAVLAIRLAKMKTIIGSPTLTYKCSAKSTQYLNAPNSIDVDVVATVHDPSFGEYHNG